MFTNNVFCITIPDRTAYLVVDTYLKDVYCQYGKGHKILSNNGSELKNNLFDKCSIPSGNQLHISISI